MGHVYDYANPRQAADQFIKTLCEICEYIGRTYKYGADMKTTLETMADPVFTEPTYPPATATRNQVRISERQVDEHVKCGTMLLKNLKMVYSLIYGQCSNAMRAKLEFRPNHETIESACTAIQLLENIRTTMYQFQLQQYSALALHEAKHHAGWMVMNLIGFSLAIQARSGTIQT
jgi:hypothetical protein